MERKVREELNELSKKVFGASSRWQKIVDKGVLEPMERTREAMIMVNGVPEKKTFTDRKSVKKHYTVDEVRNLMLSELVQRNALVHKQAIPTLANTYVEGAIPNDPGATLDVSNNTIVLPKESYGTLE